MFNSSNKYLKKPDGLGIHISQLIATNFIINFEYCHYTYEHKYRGMVAFGFIHDPFPPAELIFSKTHMNSIEISALHKTIDLKYITFRLGIGLSNNICSGYIKGLETSKRIDLYKKNKLGIDFILNIYSKEIKHLPVGLFINLKQKKLKSSGYVIDGENVFSDSFGLTEVNVGIVYKLF